MFEQYFLSTPWHFAVLPLILQPTTSPYKNQASWWLSSYSILQIEHYPVWPFQACDLEASPGKQNMLKWVLIHPGRHATHRELLLNSWENVLADPPWTITKIVFPATPELNLVSELYRASVIFQPLNPKLHKFTEPFPP